MRMKTPVLIIALAVMAVLAAMQAAFAWNPLTDLRDNVVWQFGKQAEAGLAVKLAGAGDLEPGDTATSVLAGIADYRFLTLSYGGIKVNKNDTKITDTAKIGFRITSFFDLFKNPPTAEMAFLRNLNVGPALSMPIISRTHPVTLFFDVNYAFGGAPAVTP